MTENEITLAIQKWRKYAIYGDPKEPDYGDGMPAGLRSIGLKSKYRSPQIWEAPEPDLEATKADYDKIETIYRSFEQVDQLRLKEWYFGVRTFPPSQHQKETVNRFRAKIGHLYD